MKKLAILFLLVSCKDGYAPPKVALCVTSDGVFVCSDLRKPKGEQEYTQLIDNNMICTSSPDYNRAYDYVADMREKLIKCERSK